MHLAENTILDVLGQLEAQAPALTKDDADTRKFFLLYFRRLIELLRGAVLLSRQTRDISAPNILLRSALECSIDLKNLAEHPKYYLVLQAMELDSRYSLFRYKSAPTYPALVREIGQDRALAMEKGLKKRLKKKLAEATEAFPLLQNAAHRLNVLTRFRIAGEEELYQTRYTTLSMATHNDLTLLALQEELDLELPMDALGDQSVCATALSMVVDAIRYQSQLFGVNETLVKGVIASLQQLQQIPAMASA